MIEQRIVEDRRMRAACGNRVMRCETPPAEAGLKPRPSRGLLEGLLLPFRDIVSFVCTLCATVEVERATILERERESLLELLQSIRCVSLWLCKLANKTAESLSRRRFIASTV